VLEFSMFNWSTDETYFKKNAPLEYQQWRVLQLINYGLDGERLDEHLVRRMWPVIKDKILSSEIRDYLEFVLWPEKQS
jgi:hypothetical protein